MPVLLPDYLFLRHMLLVAKTGSGKSSLMELLFDYLVRPLERHELVARWCSSTHTRTSFARSSGASRPAAVLTWSTSTPRIRSGR